VKIAKPLHRSLLIIMVFGLMALPLSVGANAKGEQLRRTMAEIALLNGQMAQRKADASGIRDSLSARLKAIETEAEQEWRQKRNRTNADALQHPRLLYDLMLIAEIEAYIDRYTEKIAFYRVACDRLSYLYQQADDDLKIVSTLSDMKVDALISQVEKILNDYLPDAQTLVVQPGTLNIAPPEKIGKRLRAGQKSAL